MKIKICIFLLVLCFLSSINAETWKEASAICPIDKTQFVTKIQGSYSIFDYRLDFFPLGAYTIGGSLLECPKCGFVFEEQSSFTASELKILETFIKTKEFHDLNTVSLQII